MTDAQIAIREETREDLKWVKHLTMSRGYDGAIRSLIEESELEIPDEPVSEGSVRRLVLGDAD